MGLPGTALTPDSPLKEAESNCPRGSRLSGRGRRLEVLDDVIQFLVELLERIPPTVEVVAEYPTSDVVYAVSWSSVSVAPNSSAAAVWNFVQYGHLTAPAAANAIRCFHFSGMFVSLSSNFLNNSQPPLKASSSHLKSSKKPGTNPNVPLMSSSVFCFVIMSPPPARCRIRELLTRPLGASSDLMNLLDRSKSSGSDAITPRFYASTGDRSHALLPGHFVASMTILMFSNIRSADFSFIRSKSSLFAIFPKGPGRTS